MTQKGKIIQRNYDYLNRTALDLTPAKWIWYPSQRTLYNTFVLFRKEFELEEEVIDVKGYVTADSRYCFYLNGERIQWGPAPSDPRHLEVDPMVIEDKLKKGKNILAFQVLYYGFGEGTWVAGTPGLLFYLEATLKNGRNVRIISDDTCMCAIDWSHRPGEFQRWYLRSLQEICDGRKQIIGWNSIDYVLDKQWRNAIEIGEGNLPSICTSYPDYANDGYMMSYKENALFERKIPMMKEYFYCNLNIAETGSILWEKDKDYWFLFREPDIYTASLESDLKKAGEIIECEVEDYAKTHKSYFYTYELEEQVVGFPYFEIDAPEGTVIELITLEGHEPGEHLLLDSSFYCWSRYICYEGVNRFEAFDFESFKWLQLHITSPKSGKIRIKNVGVRRRIYPFLPYHFQADDAAIQRLYEAGINTIYNAAQETIVDGMGRERQQYSGDGAHIQGVLRYALGDQGLCERFIQTYTDGMTKEGLFMDSWPGVDRLKRLSHRQIGLTIWGNIVDHSVQFVFDCYKYYLSTGNKKCLYEPMKAFQHLIQFFMNTCKDGLYPTDERNSGFVWLDHDAYDIDKPYTKECAINLYIAGMIEHAYIPLCKIFDYSENKIEKLKDFAENIVQQITEKYWSDGDGVFYDNLPYVETCSELQVADRTLAMAVLFGYCKNNNIKKSIELLRGNNKIMRLSYPANAVWRMWALAKAEAVEPFVKELKSVWAKLPSVLKNNSYQEFWEAYPDSTSEWSHIPAAPMLCIYEGILGLKCNNIDGNRLILKPQLKGFCSFETELYNNGEKIWIKVEKEDENTFQLIVNGANTEIIIETVHACLMEQVSENKYILQYRTETE